MTQNTDASKLLHDLRSKCASLSSAINLYKDCNPQEKREMLALMKQAAAGVTKTLEELEKLS